MNICMFTNTYLPHVGGVARSVAYFATDLCRLGHRVLVIAPTYPEGTHDEQDEAEILRVPAIQNFNGSDFSVRIALPFIIHERIDEFEPDVIHSHHPFLLGDAALRAARRRSLPLVFTHHTLYERYTHYVPLNFDALKRFVIQLSTKYANLCTKIVAPSRSVAQLIRQRGVSRPIVEIPTGIDLRFFEKGSGEPLRKRMGIPDKCLLLGHVGRLAPEKNLGYLADAAALFLKDQPQARFLVVGEGPSKAEIERIFADAGIEDQLIMPGKLTGRDLSNAYNAMDLFLFASKSETQGMVLAEAMAAGKPVITLDASGTREVVVDDLNGRLLPADATREAFADSIRQFAGDPDAAARWHREALRTARSFSREASAKRMAQVYETVAGRPDQAGGKADSELIPWDRLLRAIKVEWELMAQKTMASIDTIKDHREKTQGGGPLAGSHLSNDAQSIEEDGE